MRHWVVLLLAIATCSGCASFDVGRYGVSVENAAALKRLRPATVSVGRFTAASPGKTEITCRGVGPITTPDKRPFEDYIRQALIDELTVADLFAEASPTALSGHVRTVDFDSMVGEWMLDVTVNSSNGRSMNAAITYSYGFTYVGETACARTAKSFVPAVQILIGQLVYSPAFAELLR